MIARRCLGLQPSAARHWHRRVPPARASRARESGQNGLPLAQNAGEEPGKTGTHPPAPRLTKLARGLQVHTPKRPCGLALAQALV